MEPKYLPSHIANSLLWRADKEGVEDMTPMKLIKLVYFCYAWYLAIHGRRLFAERVEAWKYGPVIPSIYHEFKRSGSKPIIGYAVEFSPETREISYPVVDRDDDETYLIIGAVWASYKNKTAAELSQITHESSSPWTHAYAQGVNTPMDDEKIVVRAKEAIHRLAQLTRNGSR